jgi:hypothetical protein
MNRLTLMLSAMAVGAIALSGTKSASAATVIQSGDTVDGWKISFPSDVGLSLVYDNATGVELGLEKFADFATTEGIAITFTQASYTAAAQQIAILDETITDQTTSSFSGFQFLVISPMDGGQKFASTFSSISPWTADSLTPDGTSYTLSGGTLGIGDTASLGFGANGGDLVMDANPVTSGLPSDFALKEIPLTGGGGSTVVPLPAAAWTGLSGLAGVIVLNLLSKRRKRLI